LNNRAIRRDDELAALAWLKVGEGITVGEEVNPLVGGATNAIVSRLVLLKGSVNQHIYQCEHLFAMRQLPNLLQSVAAVKDDGKVRILAHEAKEVNKRLGLGEWLTTAKCDAFNVSDVAHPLPQLLGRHQLSRGGVVSLGVETAMAPKRAALKPNHCSLTRTIRLTDGQHGVDIKQRFHHHPPLRLIPVTISVGAHEMRPKRRACFTSHLQGRMKCARKKRACFTRPYNPNNQFCTSIRYCQEP